MSKSGRLPLHLLDVAAWAASPPGSPLRIAAAAAYGESLRRYGFVGLVNHGSGQVGAELHRAWTRFFALPEVDRLRFSVGAVFAPGYVPVGAEGLTGVGDGNAVAAADVAASPGKGGRKPVPGDAVESWNFWGAAPEYAPNHAARVSDAFPFVPRLPPADVLPPALAHLMAELYAVSQAYTEHMDRVLGVLNSVTDAALGLPAGTMARFHGGVRDSDFCLLKMANYVPSAHPRQSRCATQAWRAWGSRARWLQHQGLFALWTQEVTLWVEGKLMHVVSLWRGLAGTGPTPIRPRYVAAAVRSCAPPPHALTQFGALHVRSACGFRPGVFVLGFDLRCRAPCLPPPRVCACVVPSHAFSSHTASRARVPVLFPTVHAASHGRLPRPGGVCVGARQRRRARPRRGCRPDAAAQLRHGGGGVGATVPSPSR